MRSRVARGSMVGWFAALVLVVVGCAVGGPVGGAHAQGTPAWALGEQPNFAGTISPDAAWYLVNAVVLNR